MSVTTTKELTGRWARGGTRWGVRLNGDAVANIGETVRVERRDGQVAWCQIIGTIGHFPHTVYEVDGDSEEKRNAQEPDLIPVPAVEAPLKRGDLVAKTINGVVRKVEVRNAVPMVDVMWDRITRNQSMMVCEVAGEDEGNDGQQGDVEPLMKQIESLRGELDAARKEAGVMEVRLKSPEGETVKVTKDMFHACFPDIVDLALERENIWLYGPTGCGKSYICKQVAETLNLRFAFVSCTSGMSEGVLGGRLLPVGDHGRFTYVISEFIICYEQGGVFLLDEADACDPNVLLFINAALANGHVAVSNRAENPYASRHEDFVCIAAANTVGTGADRLYSGRNKIDMATLDRFGIGKIFMDYDERVEAAECPDEALRNRLLGYRQKINDHRLERAMSTRFMAKAHKMMKNRGWTMEKIDAAFFRGWREDEVLKVKGGVR